MARYRITGSPFLTSQSNADIDSLVEALLIKGKSKTNIVAECKAKFGIGNNAVTTSMRRIAERWAKEEEERRPLWKMAQVSRLNDHIAEAKEKGKWDAVGRFENLLSEITGTKEPIKVQVSHQITVAMMSVIGSLSEQEIVNIIEEQRQLEKAAALAEMLIDTNDEEVSSTD